MTPTFSTLIFVPLAVWAVLRPRRILLLLMATVGFSSTAIVNVPSLAFGFQPYHLFGSMLIARTIGMRLATGSALGTDSTVRRNDVARFVVLWALAVVAFFLAPAGTSSKVLIAQLAHLGFGIAVLWAVAAHSTSLPIIRRSCRAFEFGALFLAVWGLFQLALHLVGIPYPAFVLNTSIGQFASNYASVFGTGGFLRIGSLATEPSFLVRTLVMALAIGLTRRAWGTSHERRRRNVFALFLCAVIALSTSTTGILGLIVYSAVAVMRGRSVRGRQFVGLVALLGVLGLFLLPSVRTAIADVTIRKSTSWSYEHRTGTQSMALDAFRAHPVTGTGLGSVTSFDLATKLLSNLGLLGTVAYIVAVTSLFARNARRRPTEEVAAIRRSLRLALMLLLVMDAVASWSYTYGDFWVVGGLLLATNRVAQQRNLARTDEGRDADAEGRSEPTLVAGPAAGP